MNLLSGFIDLVPVGLMQGLTYALIAIAIMIPFRILNFADMTGEGGFPPFLLDPIDFAAVYMARRAQAEAAAAGETPGMA